MVEQTYPRQLSCPEVTGYPVWVLMALPILSFSEVGLELKVSSFPRGNMFEVLSSRVLWQHIHVYAIHLHSFCFAVEALLRGKDWRKVNSRTDPGGKKNLFYRFLWGLCVALGELVKLDSRCSGLVSTIQKGPVVSVLDCSFPQTPTLF